MKLTKSNIINFFRKVNGGPLRLDELAQQLKVRKGELSRLSTLLELLVEEGQLTPLKGKRFVVAGSSQGLRGTLTGHRDGYGFVTPDEGGEDIFIPARYLRENLHGDRVEVIVVGRGRGGKREGRITATIERGKKRIVGLFERTRSLCRVVPEESRINRDMIIAERNAGGAESGQMVVAEIVSFPTLKSPTEGKIVEVLGWPDDPSVEQLAIVRKYDLPDSFSAEASKEAAEVSDSVSERDMAGRVDLRSRVTVTIDGETAKDFDDAVSVQRERGDKTRLWVSIADVSHYVKPGSPLDREAHQRGTSVYFPDRCIPMLPERLSNGICSLNPETDRLTMTVEMLFDRKGGLLERSFYQSVIRSSARLTYSTVKDLLTDGNNGAGTICPGLKKDLKVMKKLALCLMERRKGRGSIDFDLPEPEIVLGLRGETVDIVRAERNIAHRIIEEFMLAANEEVATFIEEQGSHSIYRVHEPPDPLKLKDFREFIYHFGYDLRIGEGVFPPSEFQKVLAQADGKPEERMINEVLLRCMKQARYSEENLGHFGLAAPCYTHFTSPIRRYPDLVVHRVIKNILKGRSRRTPAYLAEDQLRETALHSSNRERTAMDAEREIVELKKIQFMKDKLGSEYDGFITGVIAHGFFVELVDLFVEGMVHVTTLPPDYYRYQEKQHAIVGERSREVYRIGDRVRVVVANVSLERKQIDFQLAGKSKKAEGSAKSGDNRSMGATVKIDEGTKTRGTGGVKGGRRGRRSGR